MYIYQYTYLLQYEMSLKNPKENRKKGGAAFASLLGNENDDKKEMVSININGAQGGKLNITVCINNKLMTFAFTQSHRRLFWA